MNNIEKEKVINFINEMINRGSNIVDAKWYACTTFGIGITKVNEIYFTNQNKI